jgi:hypothetical protein
MVGTVVCIVPASEVASTGDALWLEAALVCASWAESVVAGAAAVTGCCTGVGICGMIAGGFGRAAPEIGELIESSDFPSVLAGRRIGLVTGVVLVAPWATAAFATVAFALAEIAAASGASCATFVWAAMLASVFWPGFASA